MLNLVFGACGACACASSTVPVNNLHIELRASLQLKIIGSNSGVRLICLTLEVATAFLSLYFITVATVLQFHIRNIRQ